MHRQCMRWQACVATDEKERSVTVILVRKEDSSELLPLRLQDFKRNECVIVSYLTSIESRGVQVHVLEVHSVLS